MTELTIGALAPDRTLPGTGGVRRRQEIVAGALARVAEAVAAS